MRRAVGLRCEAALCLAICLSWLSVYILSFPLQLCLCPPLLSFMISFEPIPFQCSLPLPVSLPACLLLLSPSPFSFNAIIFVLSGAGSLRFTILDGLTYITYFTVTL